MQACRDYAGGSQQAYCRVLRGEPRRSRPELAIRTGLNGRSSAVLVVTRTMIAIRATRKKTKKKSIPIETQSKHPTKQNLIEIP